MKTAAIPKNTYKRRHDSNGHGCPSCRDQKSNALNEFAFRFIKVAGPIQTRATLISDQTAVRYFN
jgi:hypothetical protein